MEPGTPQPLDAPLDSAARAQAARAVEILRRGGLIALPTETVYGLAADAENELAVRQIFAVKGRPSSHPLIVHVGSVAEARTWFARWPEEAARLADAFWPGPLTLVLPRSTRVLDVVTGGQDTVAVRVPAHPLARELLRAFGGGVAAPSANRFGGVSPTSAAHVRADLGDEVELIVDGGPCAVGVESTIVDLSHGAPALLRPGGVAQEELERVLGRAVPRREGGEVRAPGMLASHYAPRAGVVLAERADVAARARALQAQGRRVAVIGPEGSAPEGVAGLAVPREAAGYARALYATLRDADTQGYEVLVIALPDPDGLGRAVRDRLERAAAPRG